MKNIFSFLCLFNIDIDIIVCCQFWKNILIMRTSLSLVIINRKPHSYFVPGKVVKFS